MSKQKLAELVLQKIKQKKQEEERNRPHFEVLQLLVKFEAEQYSMLSRDILELQQSIRQSQAFINVAESHTQDLQNTGKKNYPRFIIKPDFIASEHVAPLTKQFYRKSSNTFLRQDLLKKKRYEDDCQLVENIKQKYILLKDKEGDINKKLAKHAKTTNQKRVRNLKEDLRLRALRQDIINIQAQIDQEKQQNKPLIDQYELKKTNLQKRADWANALQELISKQKDIIQNVYNPVTYRQYLKKIFGIRIKNEFIHKNLLQVMKEVSNLEEQTENNERFLEKTVNLFIQGKCADSPSKKKIKRSSSRENNRGLTESRKSQRNSSLSKSRRMTEINESGAKSQYNRTFSSSLGKTATSSTNNLFKESSKKKRSMSNSAEFKKGRKQLLQY